MTTFLTLVLFATIQSSLLWAAITLIAARSKLTVITDLSGQQPYLIRWSIALPRGVSVKIHQILRADDDRCPHDHPWWMLRIILLGGYIEQSGAGARLVDIKPWRPWAPWRIYWCPASFRHRIISLTNGPSWSLVVTGGKAREWGFYTRAGWQPWRSFVRQARADRIAWCDDGESVSVSPSTNNSGGN